MERMRFNMEMRTEGTNIVSYVGHAYQPGTIKDTRDLRYRAEYDRRTGEVTRIDITRGVGSSVKMVPLHHFRPLRCDIEAAILAHAVRRYASVSVVDDVATLDMPVNGWRTVCYGVRLETGYVLSTSTGSTVPEAMAHAMCEHAAAVLRNTRRHLFTLMPGDRIKRTPLSYMGFSTEAAQNAAMSERGTVQHVNDGYAVVDFGSHYLTIAADTISFDIAGKWE